MSSLRLVIECHQRGILSKEAAESMLETRNDLIKVAMRKQAVLLVAAIQRLEPEDLSKQAGAGDFLAGIGRGPKPSGGFLSKLKSGGVSRGGAWSDVMSNLTKMMALAGLTAGASSGVGALIQHSRDKKLRGRVQESYKQMFEESPELAEMREDPERHRMIERNFGIMAEVAPSLAAIPSVAATWVRGKVIQPRMDPTDIAGLADTQRRIDEMSAARREGGPRLGPLQLGSLVTGAMASSGGHGHSGGSSDNNS